MQRKTVCIVGAGVSGIVTAKIFLEDKDKFNITIYEKTKYPTVS